MDMDMRRTWTCVHIGPHLSSYVCTSYFSLPSCDVLLPASPFRLPTSRVSLPPSPFPLLPAHSSLLTPHIRLLASVRWLLASRFSLSPHRSIPHFPLRNSGLR